VLPGGTGYITDLGMTGPYDSVLGRQKEQVLQAMITSVPIRFDVAEGASTLSGIVAEVSADSGRCTNIESISQHVPAGLGPN
jgi:calcineurin-like phosphoesterase